MRKAFLVLGLVAAGASAQAPDYIWYDSEVHKLARMLSVVGSCHHFGYVVDTEEANRQPALVVEQGVMRGVPHATAERMLFQALDDEKANMQFLAERAAQDEVAADRLGVMIEDRCAEFSVDWSFGHLIDLPENAD